jgi:hypothetical protein
MHGDSCKQVLPFEEYLSFDNGDVTYGVRSLEQIMDWKFTFDMSEDGEEEDGQAEELGEEKKW